MFYIVDSEMEVVAKNVDFDRMVEMSERLAEATGEKYFVISKSDLLAYEKMGSSIKTSVIR